MLNLFEKQWRMLHIPIRLRWLIFNFIFFPKILSLKWTQFTDKSGSFPDLGSFQIKRTFLLILFHSSVWSAANNSETIHHFSHSCAYTHPVCKAVNVMSWFVCTSSWADIYFLCHFWDCNIQYIFPLTSSPIVSQHSGDWHYDDQLQATLMRNEKRNLAGQRTWLK